jgi:hypothetical protein
MSDTDRSGSTGGQDEARGVAQPERRKASRDGRRETVVDRRTGIETLPTGVERTGLERRRGPGRRRTDYTRSAEEGEMTTEQFLFVTAIDAFKRVNRRPFPTWTEVLEVMRRLGYRKTMASELSLTGVEDWTEPADAPVVADPTQGADSEESAEEAA